MSIPNESECITILRDAGCSRRVITHCCTVHAVAREMVKGLDVNVGLVSAGALLHDIGRARDHSITHAMEGAAMAEKIGLPREMVEIIRKHTGAGLDREDVREMGLPDGDYIPRTLEEKIVAHADNMVSDNRIVPHSFSSEKLRKKGADRGADRIEALHTELSGICGRDLDAIVDILGEYPKLDGPCSQYRRSE